MNLIKAAKYTKRISWLIIPLVIVVLIMIIFFQFRGLQKLQVPQMLIDYLPGKASSLNIKLDQQPDTPKKARIYKKLNQDQMTSKAEYYSGKFGVAGTKKTIRDLNEGDGVVFQEGEKSLTIYNNRLIFVDYSSKITGPALNKEEIASKVKNTIIETLTPKLQINYVGSILYNKEGHITEGTSETSGQAVSLYYTYLIDNIPVVPYPIKVFVNSSGNIMYLNFSSLQYEATTINVPPITSKNALNNLNTTGNFLIDIGGTREDLPSLSNIGSITISKQFFAYYHSYKSNKEYLMPVWTFEGRSTLEDQDVTELFAVKALTNPKP